MLLFGNPPVLSRRHFLVFVGGAFAAGGQLGASNGEFWEKKAPGEWTPEEIDRLITKSPWAKGVNATFVPGEGGGGRGSGGGYPGGGGGGYPGGGGGYPGGGGGYPGGGGGYPGGGGGYPGGGGGIGIPGIGGIGGIGGRRRQGAPRTDGGASSYSGTVRWESARPILEATKSTLPEAFAGHYVIAVAGIPWMRAGNWRGTQTGDPDDRSSRGPGDDSKPGNEDFEELKHYTTLQPKGKDSAQAGIVQRQAGSGTVLLFGFSKEILPLTAADSKVDFSSRLGHLQVKATFNLREMNYRGALAL